MENRGLTAEEQSVVLSCMRATAAYVDQWEFHARLGFEIEDLRRLIDQWPNRDDRNEKGVEFLAINNCLNEVCHGFPIPPAEWSKWFNGPMATVRETYQNWLALKEIKGGIR
jgi:hypothetical protein